MDDQELNEFFENKEDWSTRTIRLKFALMEKRMREQEKEFDEHRSATQYIVDLGKVLRLLKIIAVTISLFVGSYLALKQAGIL